MDLTNYTPWPHLFFERRDTRDRGYGVLVLSGTFAIDGGGRPLRAVPEQEPVRLADEPRGEPGFSSPRVASAVATFKPRSDVHVDAIARAPEGRPRAEWPVRVRVGELSHDLAVRGPHVWAHTRGLGWARSAPARCTEVPLVHENAFGGSYQIDDARVEEPRNPLGTGYLPRGVPTDQPIRAPQVVAIDEPAHRPGRRYAPRGVGPIPAYFAPRTECVGTCDAEWLETKWPCVPEDFDYAYYQSAHPDLVYPGYLRGDEPVELVHVGPRGAVITAQLPGLRPFALLRLHSGHLIPMPLRLDTLHLGVAPEDPAEHRAYLTWRALIPLVLAVRRVEARMVPIGEELRLRVA